jgi:dynactin 5
VERYGRSLNVSAHNETIIQAECTIRGDFRSPRTGTDGKQSAIAIAIGRYCFLERGVTLRPAPRVYKGLKMT